MSTEIREEVDRKWGRPADARSLVPFEQFEDSGLTLAREREPLGTVGKEGDSLHSPSFLRTLMIKWSRAKKGELFLFVRHSFRGVVRTEKENETFGLQKILQL